MSNQDVLVLAEIQRECAGGRDLGVVGRRPGIVAAAGGQVVALVLSPSACELRASLLARRTGSCVIDDPQLAGYSPEPFLAAFRKWWRRKGRGRC